MPPLVNKILEKNPQPHVALSLILHNYSIASEKLKRTNMARMFSALARSFEIQGRSEAKSKMEKREAKEMAEEFFSTVDQELSEIYPKGFQLSQEEGNRGALRALTWGRKVTAVQKSLLNRYARLGDGLLKENEQFFICSACGFIAVGQKPPDICPVCKAPASRFVSP